MQFGDGIIRADAVVGGPRLKNGVADHRVVAVRQHMIVRQNQRLAGAAVKYNRADSPGCDFVMSDADPGRNIGTKAVAGVNQSLKAADFDDIGASAIQIGGYDVGFVKRFNRFFLFDEHRDSQLVGRFFLEVAEANRHAYHAPPPQ